MLYGAKENSERPFRLLAKVQTLSQKLIIRFLFQSYMSRTPSRTILHYLPHALSQTRYGNVEYCCKKVFVSFQCGMTVHSQISAILSFSDVSGSMNQRFQVDQYSTTAILFVQIIM